jgi:CRISPR-associated protein Csb1
MSIDFKCLAKQPRILLEAALKPVAGTRIQPTGFPDLGPALYDTPDGTPTLLVESAQSMANRLEAVCWDEAGDDLVPDLKGLPYVKVRLCGLGNGSDTTNSILEFHRLNSPYIMTAKTKEGADFKKLLEPQLGMVAAAGSKKASSGDEKEPDDVAGVVNLRRLAVVCFTYDPNSLIHGIFLEKIAGRLRHPRALSAFIEASGVGRADSGGVKFDRVLPKPSVAGVDAKGGYGNVPFHRSEFTAKKIAAFFSIDLAQIRGYGLAEHATQLLIALSLWKVRQFLDSTMRLRTACELEIDEQNGGITAKRPTPFNLPSATELSKEIGDLIRNCQDQKLFADPAITELIWNNPKG